MSGRVTWALAVLVGTVAAWLAGLTSFASTIPDNVVEADTPTDVIVVLTGGSGRLKEGFRLLAEKRGQKLFISGVYKGVEVEELLGLSRQAPQEISCCVVLGHTAGDTRGNAAETAGWILQKGYGSIRLVTAAYHMPRSLFEFQRLMPDITIVPNPVFPEHVKQENWWRFSGTAQLYISEFNKYMFARLRALVDPPELAAER